MKFQEKWLPLSPGDIIDMVAPGMAFDRGHLANAEKVIHGWGLKLRYPKNILGAHPVSANSRSARLEFFKKAVQSDSSVIWAARGGYGSLHLISELSKMKRPKRAKLLIGFSDITTLHHFVSQEWGWPVLHGPHVDRLSLLDNIRSEEIKKILFGQIDELKFKNLKALNPLARKKLLIKSSVTGGNLVTLQSTLGTDWQMQSAGRILFFEDIGERGYRVDRVLEHCRLMGIFDKAKAVVFGPFVGGDEPNGTSKVPKVLREFAESARIPVFEGVKSGHIANSLSLPMNTPCRLEGRGGRAELTVSTGCKK